MIEIRDLNKFYNRGKSNEIHAVNNTTLSLPDHGMIAFFGKSGCGKTTLLNIIGGLDRAQSGEVLIDGDRITPSEDKTRNKKTGYIFQNYNLSKQMTVFENVASSLRLLGVTDEGIIEERVMSALRSVEMDKYRKRFPDELSGGQQQRVAIARAIVKKPDVILADEPTGNLDEQNTVMVMDLLREISREHLVLLVTHEQDLVDLYCDEVIEIVDGGVVSSYKNTNTGGYVGKKVNDVYLGDLERSEAEGENVEVECFGEFSSERLKLRLISVGGVMYLSVPEGVKMKFADSSSEIKIHEGKFEDVKHTSRVKLEESLRTPISYGKIGRIYNFKQALKNSYAASFGRKKRGRGMLVAALVAFSMIIVLMVSLFGSAVYSAGQLKREYNTHTVFVSAEAPYSEVEAFYKNGFADTMTAFSSYSYIGSDPFWDYTVNVTFGNGHFETVMQRLGIEVSSHIFPVTSIGSREYLTKKPETTDGNSVFISRALADYMLEITSYKDIDGYDDLLELSGDAQGNMTALKIPMKIAGVVEGDDLAIYTSEKNYARFIFNTRVYSAMPTVVTPDEVELPDSLNDGEMYISFSRVDRAKNLPAVGERIKLYGKEFTVKGYIGNTIPNIDGEEKPDGGIPEGDTEKLPEKATEKLPETATEAKARAVSTDVYYESEDIAIETYPDEFYIDRVVVTHADMMKLTQTLGESHEMFDASALSGGMYYNYDMTCYALHTSDVDRLVGALPSSFTVITPDDIYDDLFLSYKESFLALSIALAIVVGVMCLCLFFIMRSSIMSEVKQIGVYRAVGVTRKNIVFRYFVETCLVFSLTVFLGYVLASFGVSRIIDLMGSMINSLLYYPAWMAVLTLAGLFCAGVICGLIPVLTLLRKTPSEILSKYDI